MKPLTQLPVYSHLAAHRDALEGVHMRQLFEDDPVRFDEFSLEVGDLLFDYSKNLVTSETMALLVRLALESGVRPAIDAMFTTEPRPL